jgi:hypothetical protein
VTLRIAPCIGALLAAMLVAGEAEASSAGLQPITLDATVIERFLPTSDTTRFGQLEFRGGLQLWSLVDRQFSSLSGLDFAEDGTLYAVTDKGWWFAAHPVMENGRLVGIEAPAMAPILNSAGEALAGKRWGDAEGLRFVERNGVPTALVVFERVNGVRAFAGPDYVLSPSVDVPVPAAVRGMTGRDGVEAIAIAPKDGPLGGAMVLVAEVLRDDKGDIRAWIVGGPRAGEFSIHRSDLYNVTDAAFLPDGDMLILERRIGLPFGISARIRRIAVDDIVAGGTVDGAIIFEAPLGYQIDNMEGMALSTGPDGETLITLVSDNNENPIQRTLLLTFALLEERNATALEKPAG